jgi:amidase
MKIAVSKLKEAGAEVFTIDPPSITLTSFRTLLDVDMAEDLPLYIQKFAGNEVKVKNVADIVSYNQQDSLLHLPYGQEIFERVATTIVTKSEFEEEKMKMMDEAISYFSIPMYQHQLDAILSIDNRSAGFAAMAHYPALGVPMGYSTVGEPQNLTLIAPSKKENLLFELAAGFEYVCPSRKAPKLYP